MKHRWGRAGPKGTTAIAFLAAAVSATTLVAVASSRTPTGAVPILGGALGCVTGPNQTTQAPAVRPTLEPGLCRVDPTIVSTLPRGPGADGYPVPSPGYHWLGGQTSGYTSAGLLATLHVVDPSVPRLPGYEDFLAHRIMAKSCSSAYWIEIGWAEVSWLDDQQYVYSYDTATEEWLVYEDYPIEAGDEISVALVSVGGGVWEARLWWNGAWQTLNSVNPGVAIGCGNEQYVEVYSRDTMAFPPIETGGSSSAVMLYPASGSAWEPWDTSVSTISGSNQEDYELDWHHYFLSWEASSSASPPPTVPPAPPVPGVGIGIPACAPPNPFEPNVASTPSRSCPT
jgi:hypothetical protein